MIHLSTHRLVQSFVPTDNGVIESCENDAMFKTPGHPLLFQPIERAIYTSVLSSEIEQFTNIFCSNYKSMVENAKWYLCASDSTKGFQFFGMLGVAALIKDHGGEVEILIPEEHKELLGRYEDEYAKIDVPVRMVKASSKPSLKVNREDSVIQDPKPISQSVTTIPPNPDIKEAARLLLESPTFKISNNRCIEQDRSRPHLQDWEKGEPFSLHKATFCGLPFFFNPGICLFLANLVDYAKPELIIDISPWKYGMTSYLAMISMAFKSKVVCMEESDSMVQFEWLEYLRTKPWADRVSQFCWSMQQDPVNLNGCTKAKTALVFSNCHERPKLELALKYVLESCESGFLVLHAENHRDVPAFVQELRKRHDFFPLTSRYDPPGGTWVSSSTFWFETPK